MTAFLLIDNTADRVGGNLMVGVHLTAALHAAGHEAILVKLGTVTHRPPKAYGYGLAYYLVTPETALTLARTRVPLLVAGWWKHRAPFAAPLLAAGVPVLLHGPWEVDYFLAATGGQVPGPVLTVRPSLVTYLAARGVAATCVPHPYVPAPTGPAAPRTLHAACVTRLAAEKHIDLILAANALLPPAQQVGLYGSDVSGVYAYRRLTPRYPDWQARYHRGALARAPGAAVSLLRTARFAVDLSAYPHGDGGGTQYAFLEAWDAGAALVVHAAWPTPTGVVQPGVNCLAAADAPALAATLAAPVPPALAAGGAAVVAAHAPAVVLPAWYAALGLTAGGQARPDVA